MNYEKKYKEANDKIVARFGTNVAKEIFTDLYESEDERIRKSLISYLHGLGEFDYPDKETYNNWLVWLEKQDEQEQLYIRFGDIPTDEQSKIYEGETEVGTENGVSVYPAFKTSEGDIVLGLSLPITKTTLHTQQHLIEYDDRPCYLVKGDYVGKDTDGQPLINNVSIIEKIDTYRVKEEKRCENKETLCDRCKKEQPSHSCQDITALGRCYIEGMNTSNNVESTFKVGDWITFYSGKPFQVIKIEKELNGKLDYLLLNTSGHDSYYDKNYVNKNARLWAIQDAKAGDVLATEDGRPFIFKDCSDIVHPDAPVAYCGINADNKFIIPTGNDWWTNSKVYPATKEQCELLLKKMKEAGYEWVGYVNN